MSKLSRWAVLGLLGGFALVAGACTQPAPANKLPIAVITATPDAGDPPLAVTFSSAGSADPDGTISSYSWNFGDGSPLSTEANPVHTFTANGAYVVRLTVRDNRNVTGSTTKVIQVGPGANASPTAIAYVTPISGSTPLEVSFTGSGSSDPDGSIVLHEWDFDDGSPVSNEADTTHEYTVPGLYTVTLTVVDNEGAAAVATRVVTVTGNHPPVAAASASVTAAGTGESITFSSVGSSDVEGPITYSWNFDDGTPASTVANPIHAYSAAGNYTATLTVTDAGGVSAIDTVEISVTANPAPVATIDTDVTAGPAPLTVQFDATGSSDDGSVVSYLWNFGGGVTSTNAVVSKSFTSPGPVTVTLTVTDNLGAQGSSSVVITVDAPPNQAPNAAAAATTPTTGKAPLTVSFSSAGTNDPDGTISSYAWSFSDGGTSTSPNPSHTFAAAGNHSATLVVTDNDGGTDTATVNGIVAVPNQAPTAVAAGTPLTITEGQSVAFSSAGSGDADGGITSYSWNFGDSSPLSSAQNPSHTYTTPGSFTATLTVTDAEGASGQATVNVTVLVNDPPTAAANATPVSGARPLVVAFSSAASVDAGGSIVGYSWDFGDSTPDSTQADPSHTYTSAGSFTATLTVTDNGGKTDTATVDITVVIDDDGDGVGPATDCDDSDPTTYPGAADPLDTGGADNNCDGADGDASSTAFVATGGSDAGACTVVAPCATIAGGEAKALATGRNVVQVASGTYGPFGLSGGLTIRGGYASGFATRSGTTTVNGSAGPALTAVGRDHGVDRVRHDAQRRHRRQRDRRVGPDQLDVHPAAYDGHQRLRLRCRIERLRRAGSLRVRRDRPGFDRLGFGRRGRCRRRPTRPRPRPDAPVPTAPMPAELPHRALAARAVAPASPRAAAVAPVATTGAILPPEVTAAAG